MLSLYCVTYCTPSTLNRNQFDYDNGFGDSVGRFKLDLYQSQGEGDCGTWVTSVCAKPDTGCLDTREFMFAYKRMSSNAREWYQLILVRVT